MDSLKKGKLMALSVSPVLCNSIGFLYNSGIDLNSIICYFLLDSDN